MFDAARAYVRSKLYDIDERLTGTYTAPANKPFTGTEGWYDRQIDSLEVALAAGSTALGAQDDMVMPPESFPQHHASEDERGNQTDE